MLQEPDKSLCLMILLSMHLVRMRLDRPGTLPQKPEALYEDITQRENNHASNNGLWEHQSKASVSQPWWNLEKRNSRLLYNNYAVKHILVLQLPEWLITAINSFHSIRNDRTGAVKFAGAAVKFCHAWIVDIHIVCGHKSKSCYNSKDLATGDGRMLCIIAQCFQDPHWEVCC